MTELLKWANKEIKANWKKNKLIGHFDEAHKDKAKSKWPNKMALNLKSLNHTDSPRRKMDRAKSNSQEDQLIYC